mgnify:FL=1
MRTISTGAVSIIGGADGPTSVFIAGKSQKQPLTLRIKQAIYRHKRKEVEKTIVADPHSLVETVQYAKKKYKFTEAAPTDREYLEQRECLKESLILQYKPEVLGEMQDIPAPDYTDEEAIKKYIEKMEVRREMIAELPDNIIPMDFHLYRVQVGDGMFEMGIDYKWDILGISYSGDKKEMKFYEKISKELYRYYGVEEADIKNKTKRYSALVTALST